MERHWTLDLVAFAGILAGFVCDATGQGVLLAGGLAAACAYALILPELAASPSPSALEPVQ